VTHTYRTQLSWSGSTAAGYEGYDRAHILSAPPAEQELRTEILVEAELT
jgi:hypothetical protein